MFIHTCIKYMYMLAAECNFMAWRYKSEQAFFFVILKDLNVPNKNLDIFPFIYESIMLFSSLNDRVKATLQTDLALMWIWLNFP